VWGREKRGAAPVALTLPFAFHPPIPSLTMAFTTLARAPAGVAALPARRAGAVRAARPASIRRAPRPAAALADDTPAVVKVGWCG